MRDENLLKRKAVSGIAATLLLLGMLVLTFNIRPVKAIGTIYIRADGSIDPSTAPIQRDMNVYTFTDDIYNNSIVMQRNDVTLDGNGYLLQWCDTFTYHNGIELSSRNVTITNIVISGFFSGISLDSSYYNKIVNNTILGSKDCGIKLYASNYNILVNNTVMNTNEAISLEQSSFNSLSGNRVANNVYGISLFVGKNNKLRNNAMIANEYSFFVGYFYREYYVQDVDTSNTVDGKPVYYWINRRSETIPLDAGCAVVVNSSEITVKNLIVRNNEAGITLAYTTNSLIENVTAIHNGAGINLDHSDFNVITKNKVTSSRGAGIGLIQSAHNTLSNNIALNTTGAGIWLEDTTSNTVIGNNIAYTSGGSGPQEFDGGGILVDDSPFCKVIGNNVTENHYGIVLGAFASRYNLIIENNIAMNDVGLILYEGSGNTVYHNNFVGNKQAQISTYIQTQDSFDNGYPSGGNFWSDYSGLDFFKGLYQNEAGSDGIGDTARKIDEINQDRYPLMKPYPWGPHDLGVLGVDTSKTVVGQGFLLNINVTVFNYGPFTENFNLRVYANTTIIQTKNLNLAGRTSATITFIWNTSSFVKGSYTVKAYAIPVPGETVTTDNTYVGKTILVSLPGDVIGDRKVDGRDVAIMAKYFGRTSGYAPNADITNDGKIDGKDIAVASKNFGKTWT